MINRGLKEENIAEACRDYILSYGVKALDFDIIHIYKGEEYAIGAFRKKAVEEYEELDGNDKLLLISKYDNIDSTFLFEINRRKKVNKIADPTNIFNKKNKSATISSFRVDEELYKKVLKKINKIKEKNPSFKQTDYLTDLLIKDMNNNSNISNDYIAQTELINALKSLILQIAKNGNNINQIARALNIIKKKDSLDDGDKNEFKDIFNILKMMNQRFEAITKRILGLKLT